MKELCGTGSTSSILFFPGPLVWLQRCRNSLRELLDCEWVEETICFGECLGTASAVSRCQPAMTEESLSGRGGRHCSSATVVSQKSTNLIGRRDPGGNAMLVIHLEHDGQIINHFGRRIPEHSVPRPNISISSTVFLQYMECVNAELIRSPGMRLWFTLHGYSLFRINSSK